MALNIFLVQNPFIFLIERERVFGSQDPSAESPPWWKCLQVDAGHDWFASAGPAC